MINKSCAPLYDDTTRQNWKHCRVPNYFVPYPTVSSAEHMPLHHMPNKTTTGKNAIAPMNMYPQNMYPQWDPYRSPMGVPLLPLYGYDNSEDLDRDIKSITLLYPRAAMLLHPHILEECDKLEYDGSLMFDEYPDKVLTEQIVNRIYEKAKNLEEYTQVTATNVSEQNIYRQNYFRDIISLLLLNEFINRRRRYRSRKRWF
jgi:hypothetical protein